MTSVSISKNLIAKLKPRPQAYDVRDNRLKGFMVRVHPTGGMTYVVQYDRAKRINLGKVNVLTPAQARERAIKILSDYACGSSPREPEVTQRSVPTLKVFLENEYGTWVKTHNISGEDAIKTIYRHFNHLMNMPLDQIGVKHIDGWRAKKLELGSMKKNTINRTVTPLRSAITKAVEWGVIEQHGLAGLKILKYDDTRIRYLEEEEKEKLFYILKKREKQMRQQRTNANVWRKARSYKLFSEIETSEFADHLLPMFILALNTGIRKGELLQLTRSDINLKKGTLFVAKSKNYLSRYVPLNKTASGALQTWMNQTDYMNSKYLFVSPLNPSKPITSIQKAWRKAVDESGISNLRWHDLRHDFASNLVMKDVSLYAVQKLLGHKKIDQTMKYAHLAADFIAESVAKLDK
jgi:integrase